MLEIFINNETSRLKSVVLGTALDFGGTPTEDRAYDPKSKENIRQGTFPRESDLKNELNGFEEVLLKHDVEVLRPEIIPDCNQIFSRDIGFVIDHKFIRPNILDKRIRELSGTQYIIDQIPPEDVIYAPPTTRIEGGDVMPWNEMIFIGYSEKEDFEKYEVSRTNKAGVDFLQSIFPNRTVKALELKKSDTDPMENCLHLDCCFQPIGKNQAIIYPEGFKHRRDYEFLVKYFGKNNIINIDKEEMYRMNSNVFSISPDTIISEISFTRLNDALTSRGFKVETIKFHEVAKMEGLLRCTTMPLRRVD